MLKKLKDLASEFDHFVRGLSKILLGLVAFSIGRHIESITIALIPLGIALATWGGLQITGILKPKARA